MVLRLHICQVNIADDPSREDYDIFRYLPEGADRVDPVLDIDFAVPQAWESLSLSSLAKTRVAKRRKCNATAAEVVDVSP